MGMATTEQSTADTHAETGVRRRDFINIPAVSFAGVGAATAVIPLVNQMNPSADVLPLASLAVDVSATQPAQPITAILRAKPAFIRTLPASQPEEDNKNPQSKPRT